MDQRTTVMLCYLEAAIIDLIKKNDTYITRQVYNGPGVVKFISALRK